MRSRAGLVAVLGGALALHCSGQSETVESKHASGGALGGTSGAGRAGQGGAAGSVHGGNAGCTECAAGESSVGGSAGRGGADSSGGVAGQARAGTSAAGSSGRGRAGGAAPSRGGTAGGGGSSPGGTSPGGSVSGATSGSSSAGASGETGSDGLTLHEVAIYQAVEIPLMVDGDEREPNANAPLVADREAMLRVWVEPGADFAPRQIAAEVSVTAGSSTRTTRSVQVVGAASTDGDLKSTLNFALLASEVTSTSTVSVVLREDTAGAEPLAHWPPSGARELEAQSSNGPFLITLVPLVANGYLPDTSETIRLRFERYMAEIYPASTVDVSVAYPLELDYSVDPDGTGWDEALDDLLTLRDDDNVDANVYYYGLLTPGATFDGYCQGDCVVGLSNVAGRTQTQYRGSIGTGFFETSKDTFSQETMAHELGHALGREHSPCGTSDAERAYPYKSGGIGVWGYNGTRLLDPGKLTDVMGYCVPVWISDYTYDHLFDRIAYVNGLAQRSTAARRVEQKQHRTLRVGFDGRLAWGRDVAVGSDDDDELASVDLLDANGRVVRTVTAPFAPFDHLPGGFLSVPLEALGDPDVARVRIGGRTIDVR
jgi:hypothetical protein